MIKEYLNKINQKEVKNLIFLNITLNLIIENYIF